MAEVLAVTGILVLNALFLLWLQRGAVRYAPARRLADDAERLARRNRRMSSPQQS